MRVAPVLVLVREGNPRVPRMNVSLFPQDVGGRVQPPFPAGIKRSQPLAQWGEQLPVRVARNNKEGLKHELPGGFGIAAGGFELGPVWGRNSVGMALAVPDRREDMGASRIAEL